MSVLKGEGNCSLQLYDVQWMGPRIVENAAELLVWRHLKIARTIFWPKTLIGFGEKWPQQAA